MKKLLLLVSALVLAFALAGCSQEEIDYSDCVGNCELALITDKGTIDDKSFNQGAWEGMVQYAEENEIFYKYYQPDKDATDTTAEYVKNIDLAVDGGAKTIVTPGFLFQEAVHIAQEKYPEVTFILLDGYPHDGSWAPDVADNTYSIFYAEHQSGYLAGYAAVKDGYTELGFMGGMAVPAVVRFGHGFVQGAEDAATEMGVDVNIKYNYLGDFAPKPEFQTKAASWYTDGTEVIFVAAGGAGGSVMAAAEEQGAKVIGVDVDQSSQSDTVISSAMKELSISVYECLTEAYAGTADLFVAGTMVTMDASNNGVGLPMATSKFNDFTEAMYEEIFAKLVDGTVEVIATMEGDEATTLEAFGTQVTVEFIQ